MSYLVSNSPHVRKAQKAGIDPKAEAWPPKSPYEALLSSPSGRKKAEQRTINRDGSPTPRTRRKLDFSPGQALQSSPNIEEQEEDEETLQLQLAEIQAKLKLKKIQKSNTVQDVASLYKGGSVPNGKHARDRSLDHDVRPEKRARVAQPRSRIDISQSPERRPYREPEEQRSPGRYLLGIDKGRKAENVSLGRAPRFGGPLATDNTREAGSQKRQNGLVRSTTQTLNNRVGTTKTFSERLNEDRERTQTEQERSLHPKHAWSNGFGISDEAARLQRATAALQAEHMQQGRSDPKGLGIQDFDRAAILEPRKRTENSIDSTRTLPRSHTVADFTTLGRNEANSSIASSSRPSSASLMTSCAPLSSSSSLLSNHATSSKPDPPDHDPDADLDPFSSLYLSRRSLTPDFLRSTFSGKRIFKLPDLLRVVKSPEYNAPDCPEDWIVLGVVASKSEPRSHQQTQDSKSKSGDQDERGKYMVLSLTDLKWQLELFLFGASFARYRNVLPGTLVAIMNPKILPPRANARESGKFSLCLSDEHAGKSAARSKEPRLFHSRNGDSDDEDATASAPGDSLLELGLARDLGWCKSTKSDGSACKDWVNKRRSEFCEFHVGLEVSKRQRGRMEVNSMVGGGGQGGSSWKRSGSGSRQYGFEGRGSGRGGRGGKGGRDIGANVVNGGYELGQYYVTPGGPVGGRSAANLIDEDIGFGRSSMAERGLTREDRMKRQLARSEKERDIARKLSQKSKDAGDGGGIGGAYLRHIEKLGANRGDEEIDEDERRERAQKEERLANRVRDLAGTERRAAAAEVRLSPIRKSRTEWSVGISGMGEARGRMSREGSPVKRQKGITRFLTETGIKEAGVDISTVGDVDGARDRDRLGNEEAEEDELDIV